MSARELAADMIQRWAKAQWPVQYAVSGRRTPLTFLTRGRIVICRKSHLVVATDGSATMLPSGLMSAGRVEVSSAAGGVTELRFHFPGCEIRIGDFVKGGSDAVH